MVTTDSIVSVIIPTRNSGAFLRSAIQSVTEQTYTNLEITVVDDGSTEDLAWIAKEFPHVQLLKQPPSGISVARNTGILAARGEFVAFLDADDLWSPGKIRKQVDALLQNPDCALCYTKFEVIDADGVLLQEGEHDPQCDFFSLLKAATIKTSSVLVRREALFSVGLFDPLLVVAEDVELFLRLSSYYRLIAVNSVETRYRVHGSNTSATGNNLRGIIDVYERHMVSSTVNKETDKSAAAAQAVRSTYSWWHIALARSKVQDSDFAGAFHHLFTAFRYDAAPVVASLLSWLQKRSNAPQIDQKG